jgi:ADP-heptose:LPS heptosyltransferase
VLVVRLGAVGDVVRTLPAVSSLRAGFAGAHLAWLVEPRSAGVLEGQPWIDEAIVFPRPTVVEALRRGALATAGRALAEFARGLRARRFDLVVDFHSILRSALMVRASGAPVRVGYARPFGRELSWLQATHRAQVSPRRISRFERNQALVRYLGVGAPPSPTPYRVDPERLARMEASLGAEPRPAAIHPGSSDAAAHKRWSAAAYGRLARALADTRGLRSWVTWGPARGEREVAQAVVDASGGAARLAPETPRIADLAALLAVSRLYVGGDTGPMHVASLVGTPVLQILGPTHPVENAPWQETPSRTIETGAAMEARTEPVLAAALELLDETRSPGRLAGGQR